MNASYCQFFFNDLASFLIKIMMDSHLVYALMMYKLCDLLAGCN